jgi:hypothetical protein
VQTSASVIEEYFEEVGDQYNIDLQHFKLICNTPFRFVKKIMSSGVLENIRIQYLGIFKVSPSRVHYSKKTLQENFDNGLISEKRYTDRFKVLSNYEI